MFEILKADFKRYVLTPQQKSLKNVLVILFYEESLWFIIAFRFGQWIRKRVHILVLRQVLMVVSRILHRLLWLITGIEIDLSADIGLGLYIGHGGKVVVHPEARIGKNCNLSTGVVIGIAGRGDQRGVPIIGDRVFIAPGAKIIGKLVIGNDVAIGANAVVTKDVHPKAVVAGVPARVINFKGSAEFIQMYSEDL